MTNHLHFPKIIFVAFLNTLLTNVNVNAQEQHNVVNRWIHFSDALNSLYHHLGSQGFDLLDKRANSVAEIQSFSVAEIQSLPGWKKRQELVRKTLLDNVGQSPTKNSLNPKIVTDGYKVQKIVFKSDRDFTLHLLFLYRTD